MWSIHIFATEKTKVDDFKEISKFSGELLRIKAFSSARKVIQTFLLFILWWHWLKTNRSNQTGKVNRKIKNTVRAFESSTQYFQLHCFVYDILNTHTTL